MGNYLVTGACGFIGSHLCALLLREGHDVVGVDNLNDYYDVKLKLFRLSLLLKRKCDWNEVSSAPIHAGPFTFHALDIEDFSRTRSLFGLSSFDAVFNLAARAGVRYSMENPHVYFTTNAIGTLNLLECMREMKVRKLVLASTSSLYAGCEMPFLESLPVNTPISPYAASKKAAEAVAYSYHHLYGIDVSILRYFTVFGPGGRPDMSIFRFIEWIRKDRPIELLGDGHQARDFTYVTDIALGTYKARRAVGYEVINLGGGRNPITLTEVIGSLERALAKKATIERREAHRADMTSTWADIDKAKKLLDWAPSITPDVGFRLTVEWHKENAPWLDGIKI